MAERTGDPLTDMLNIVQKVAPRKFIRAGIPYDEVDDLVQEVHLRVIQNMHTYDPAKSMPSTWLYRVIGSVMATSAERRQRTELKDIPMDFQAPASIRDAREFAAAGRQELELAAAVEADSERKPETVELSERAEKILDLVRDFTAARLATAGGGRKSTADTARAVAEHCFGMGNTDTAAAELVGVTARSVARQKATLRDLFASEDFQRAVAA